MSRWIPVFLSLLVPAYLFADAVSGTVTFSDGSPVVGVGIRVMIATGAQYRTTDALGNWSMSLPAGTLIEQAQVYAMGEEVAGCPSSFSYTFSDTTTVSGPKILDARLPSLYRMHGVLRSPSGNPVPGVTVRSQHMQNGMGFDPSDQSTTDNGGAFELFSYAGSTQVTAPAVADSDIAAYTMTLELTKDTLLNISYPAAPTVSGVVTLYNGSPARKIEMGLSQGTYHWLRTDSTGAYRFVAGQGVVSELLVHTMNDTTVPGVPADMSFSAAQNFSLDRDTVINITLPLFPLLHGLVRDGQGTPVAGARLQVSAWNGSMTNQPDDYCYSAVDGYYELACNKGGNKLEVTAPMGTVFSGVTLYPQLNADSTLNITLPKGAVVCGKVVLSDSTTPVVGITVALADSASLFQTTTDGSGSFRLVVAQKQYQYIQAFTMSQEVAGIPAYISVKGFDGWRQVGDSTAFLIVMPPLCRIYGTVQNSAHAAVGNVRIEARTWTARGTTEPADWSVTPTDGSYELFMPIGPCEVTITPQSGAYNVARFMMDVGASVQKDLLLTDQDRGIARIQPSTISQGKEGTVTITGVNTDFLGASPTLDLGPGITVSDVSGKSAISLTAHVAVDSNAEPGVRSITCGAGGRTYAGTELLTVTAPSSARLPFDNAGILTRDVTIDDGTGTQLHIDSGTTVTLPPGADSTLSFDAPIIKNDTVQPSGAEFTQVQRECYPSGVTFNPPAELTFHYQDQDVQGISESSLAAFKYDNGADSVVGEYAIVARDTANNTITQSAPTFSLYRLAAKTGTAAKGQAPKFRTACPMLSVSAISGRPGALLAVFSLPQTTVLPLLKLYDVKGRCARAAIRTTYGPQGYSGQAVIAHVAAGSYLAVLEYGAGKRLVRPVAALW